MNRCWWCRGDALYEQYHDEVWGREEHDDRVLFEMLSLELFQSGLSWITVLRKRENFREAFAHWDVAAIAAFDESKQARLMEDKGIIRNRKKIAAVINNARLVPDIVAAFGSFDRYVHGFRPRERAVPKGGFRRESLPLLIDEAKSMSKDMKKRGFRFTGPMVCMSFMQAVGIINDHVHGCDLCPF